MVGSNEQENRFRILKLDRTEPKRLFLLPEAKAGSLREIKSIIATIDGANAGSESSSTSGSSAASPSGIAGQKGINKILSAYGIAGFVRFLEGYYIIFIVRRLKCAMLGFHAIYKIKETKTVYIPNSDARHNHQDETRYGVFKFVRWEKFMKNFLYPFRYAKMFASMDMTENFYYSYSYDLTNTLQHNLATPKLVRGRGTVRVRN